MGSGSWHSCGKPCQIRGGIRCFETVPASYLSRQQIISVLMEGFWQFLQFGRGPVHDLAVFGHIFLLGAAALSPLLGPLYFKKPLWLHRVKGAPHLRYL